MEAAVFLSWCGEMRMEDPMKISRCVGLIALLFVFIRAAESQAQSRDAALAVIMKLPAAERQQRLVDGAKKESGLVWYSSITAEDALALAKKFNEQHPSIKIQHFRSSSEKLLERILVESRGNAFKADIVTLPELELPS